MKKPTPRTVTTVVAVALAAWALSVDLPKPWLDAPHPLENDSLQAVAGDSDSLAAVSDTLHSGETIGALLVAPRRELVRDAARDGRGQRARCDAAFLRECR